MANLRNFLRSPVVSTAGHHRTCDMNHEMLTQLTLLKIGKCFMNHEMLTQLTLFKNWSSSSNPMSKSAKEKKKCLCFLQQLP